MVTRTHDITTAPDLTDEWRQLEQDQKVRAMIANRATDENIQAQAKQDAERMQDELGALADKIADAARTITIRRLEPKAWGRLVAEHPPRPGDAYDARLGVNTETFDRALMPQAISSVVDFHGRDVDWDWPTLANAMSPGQFEEILSDTIQIHTERDAVPFSRADYESRRPSEQK